MNDTMTLDEAIRHLKAGMDEVDACPPGVKFTATAQLRIAALRVILGALSHPQGVTVPHNALEHDREVVTALRQRVAELEAQVAAQAVPRGAVTYRVELYSKNEPDEPNTYHIVEYVNGEPDSAFGTLTTDKLFAEAVAGWFQTAANGFAAPPAPTAPTASGSMGFHMDVSATAAPEGAEYIAREVYGDWIVAIPNSSACVLGSQAAFTEKQAKYVAEALNDAFKRGERRRSADLLNILQGGDK